MMRIDNVDYAEIANRANAERFYSPRSPLNDYSNWARWPMWTAEEAIALSFGLEPHDVDWDELEKQASQSELAREISHSRKRLNAAKAAGDIALPARPYLYMEWIKARGIVVPNELMESVNKLGRPVPDWEMLYRECKNKLSTEEKQQPSKAAESDRPLGTQAKHTLYRLILGMAIGGYRYDPRRDRNDATKDIFDDLDSVGLEVSQGTILEKLRQAAQELDFQMPGREP